MPERKPNHEHDQHDPHAVIDIPGSKPFASAHSTRYKPEGTSVKIATGIPLSADWNDIPAIRSSRGMEITSSEQLVFIVELPLYKACRMLYDAGIKTTETNAHFEPDQTKAPMILGIDWSSLSDLQRNVAEDLCTQEPDKWVHISAEEHGDNYEGLYLRWEINKDEVSPRQVKAYVEDAVQRLIKGKIKLKGSNKPSAAPSAEPTQPLHAFRNESGRIVIKGGKENPLPEDWDLLPVLPSPDDTEHTPHLESVLLDAQTMLRDTGISPFNVFARPYDGTGQVSVGFGIPRRSLTPKQLNMAKSFLKDDPTRWTGNDQNIFFHWRFKKDEVNPRQVKANIDNVVQRLIKGKMRLFGH